MISKEAAYTIIEDLVTRFEEQITSYKKTDYNETQTHRDFIDPFFKALGWDMDNSQGKAEAFRKVTHEEKIKIGAAIKSEKELHDEIVQKLTSMLQQQKAGRHPAGAGAAIRAAHCLYQ